jgi:hypothetical protein
MTKAVLGIAMVLALVLGSCSGGSKQEIPLADSQTYELQSSGKMTVYPAGGLDGKQGSQPLHGLRVKRKNEGAGSKTEGCWRCSDCICNGDHCSCTECTSF